MGVLPRALANIAVVAVVVISTPRGADAEEHLRVLAPDTDNLQYAAFWIAEGAGYFAEEGLAIDIAAPPTPQGTTAMVQAGGFDVFVLPPPVYIDLIAERAPLLLVANLLQNDPIDLIVQRSVFEAHSMTTDAPVADRLRSLHGLKVGVAPGPETRLRALFASVGLDADRDVETVVIHGKDQNAAFARGDVDALFCHTPFLETALVEQDARLLVNTSRGEVAQLASRQIHALVVTKAFAAAREPVVRALVRAIARAEILVHQHRDDSVAALMHVFPSMDRTKVDALMRIYDAAIPETPRVSVDGIEGALALFPASRTPPSLRGIDLHDFVAPAFAEATAVSPTGSASTPAWRRRWSHLSWIAFAAIALMALAMRSRRRRR